MAIFHKNYVAICKDRDPLLSRHEESFNRVWDNKYLQYFVLLLPFITYALCRTKLKLREVVYYIPSIMFAEGGDPFKGRS